MTERHGSRYCACGGVGHPSTFVTLWPSSCAKCVKILTDCGTSPSSHPPDQYAAFNIITLCWHESQFHVESMVHLYFSQYRCQNWRTLILICRFQYHYGHLLWPVTLSDINIELLIAICPRCCNTLMLLTDPLWVVSRRGAAAMNSTWFQFWLIKEFIRKKVDKELFITSFEFHTCWTFFLEMFELTFRHLVAETQKITSLKVTSFHNSNPLLARLYSLHSTFSRPESGWRPKMSMCMWKVKYPSHPLIINTASHFPRRW